MSSTSADAPATGPTPRALLVASTLSWFLGILAIGSGLTIGIPFESVPGGAITLAVLAGGSGSAFCYAGYGLRKRRRSAGWAALAAAIAVIGLRLETTSSMGPIELFAAVLMVLVAANWKHLRARGQPSAPHLDMQPPVASLRALLKRTGLGRGRAVAPAAARSVKVAPINPELSPMNQRQLASVLFAAAGVFIVLSHLEEMFMLVAALTFSILDVDGYRMPAGGRLGLAVTLVGVVLPVLCGLVLILFRDRVANLLFPQATDPVSSPEFQAVALSVLGCYFAVHAVSKMVQAERLDSSRATQLVLGIALFFGARGLARLWSWSRSRGQQPDPDRAAV